MDYYAILEIEKTATLEEVKKSYRRLAMKYHPDRTKGDKEAETKFKQINEAYSVLSDDSKRKQYDTFGKVSGASSFQGAGFDVDLGDIFESFFGGGFSSQSRGARTQRGEDIEQTLDIDLKTSIYGGKKKISYDIMESCSVCNGEGGKGKKTCSKCSGSGHITYTKQSIFGVIQQTGVCDVCSGTGEQFEEICSKCFGNKRVKTKKDLDLDIPAGIDHGMVIKLEAEGNAGIGTKARGGLYIRFRVNLEERGLKRRKTDLFYELEIDVLEAIMGTKKQVNIPVIGKRTISVASGTQPGTIIKISGDGVKFIDKDAKGDLYITFKIKIPKKLTKKEKSLYLELAKEKKLDVNNEKGIFEKIFG